MPKVIWLMLEQGLNPVLMPNRKDIRAAPLGVILPFLCKSGLKSQILKFVSICFAWGILSGGQVQKLGSEIKDICSFLQNLEPVLVEIREGLALEYAEMVATFLQLAGLSN